MEHTIGLAYQWNGDSYDCTGMGTNTLTDIVIPSTFDDGINGLGPVTSIRAFTNNQLTSVVIPDSVTSISGFANNQLTSVTIPSSVTSVGWGTFRNNQLTSVVWETSLGIPSAFAGTDNKITSFTITSNNVVSLANAGDFSGVTVDNPMTVYVQRQLIEDYKTAYGWSSLYNDGRATFESIPLPKSRKLGTLYANTDSTEFTTLKAVKKETARALVESDSLELNTLYVDNSESSETPESIKEKYESNANTNAFTDLDKNKVDIINVNGDGNKYLSNDGSYKIVNSGIPEAPIDNKAYGRQDGEWTNLNMLIDNSIQQAIEDVLLGEV